MKILLALSILLLSIYSCQSNSTENDQSDSTPEASEEHQNESEETVTFLYKSTEDGTTEYMKMQPSEDGTREWYYWSDKKEEEIKLGVKTIDGLEAVYFSANPSKQYEMVVSECGFTLFLGEKRLQWYEQVEPSCERPY